MLVVLRVKEMPLYQWRHFGLVELSSRLFELNNSRGFPDDLRKKQFE